MVWSSDCDSGKFDSNTESSPYVTPGVVPGYSEFWLEDGKAVGTVGSSRISYIYQDGFLLQGMGTSLFPEEGNIFRVLLGGSPVAPVLQLGQLVVAAKSYMETETAANMSSDDGPRGSALEYNAFGDPSMPILRNAPLKFVNPVFHGSLVDANDCTADDQPDGAGQHIGQPDHQRHLHRPRDPGKRLCGGPHRYQPQQPRRYRCTAQPGRVPAWNADARAGYSP